MKKQLTVQEAGRKGGKGRAKNLTKKELTEIAMKGVEAKAKLKNNKQIK
jgi:general stress protein YciG